MRPDRSVGRAVLAGTQLFVFLAAVSLAYAWGGGRADEDVVIVMLINLVLVLSLQIYIGNTGVLSFGHVVFPAIAGYAAAWVGTAPELRSASVSSLPFGLDDVELAFVPSIVVGLAIVLIAAAMLGAAVARVNGLGAAILTFAFLVVVHEVLLNWNDVTGGAQGFYGIPLETTIGVALTAAFACILIARLFKDSRWGLWAQAGREDELVAGAMGVGVVRSRYLSWVVSAVVGGLSGVLLSFYVGALTPNDFYIELTFVTIAFLILGGMRSVTGAVVGTVLLTAVLEVARRLAEGPVVAGVDLPEIIGLSQLCLGATIVGVMILRPGGLVGDHELDDRLPWGGRRHAVKRPPAGGRPDSVATSRARSSAGHARDRILAAHGVSKSFEGIAALSDVSMDVGAGEILGVIGPNGAGKTTLLNVLSGNLSPTDGVVEFRGERIERKSPIEIARMGMARTFQNLRLFEGLSVRDNVEVAVSVGARYGSFRSDISTPDLLERFGLSSRASDLAVTLAQGDRRRLELARAVGLGPILLLLDEPTAGMNELEATDLLTRIREVRDEFGCGVVVVDHNVPFVMDLCERVLVLHGGREIARGKPDEIQQHPEVIEAYLGIRADPEQPAVSTQ